jgi:hypothetical protein
MTIRATDNSDEAEAATRDREAPALILTRAQLDVVQSALREAEINARFDRARAYSETRQRATQTLVDQIVAARAIVDPNTS